MKFLVFLIMPFWAFSNFSSESDAVKSLSGCFVVDYNYSEYKKIDPNYKVDARVYDVNRFVVKELVKVVNESSNKIRLQRFMLAENEKGEQIFQMRHHGEIWEHEPAFIYNYQGRFNGNDQWHLLFLSQKNIWSRRITSLDDGMRHQCFGKWELNENLKTFECSSFSPIPGREYRDMKRRDYNTMMRNTKVMSFGDSWLERQENEKIVFENGERKPLVKEKGKIWSVRVKDSECSEVNKWATERQPIWDLLEKAWEDVFNGERNFNEIKKVEGTTRFSKIQKVISKYYKDVTKSEKVKDLVFSEFKKIINLHRE